MTTPQADLVATLVEPLLDARVAPAAQTFDALLAEALADGRIGAELAHELRFWQRTSVREVTDHVRLVLPTVLPVALAVVAASAEDAMAAADAATSVWRDRGSGPAAAVHPALVDPAVPAEPVPSGPDETVPAEATAAAADAGSLHLRRRLFVAGLTSTA